MYDSFHIAQPSWLSNCTPSAKQSSARACAAACEQRARRRFSPHWGGYIFGLIVLCTAGVAPATEWDTQPASVVRTISGLSEKMELTVNSSRILTLDKNIPRVQVNNPDLLAVTPLSATQVQVSAKKAGVTQINLWDEEGNIHTVDVLIYGDVRELEVALQTQFPHSSIKVYRYSESLVLKGFVDRPDHVGGIVRLAEDYAPKVINNVQVGGVQQVLLKVKVYEVSRTKLRRLGVDWAFMGRRGGYAMNSVSDILSLDDEGVLRVSQVLDTFSFGIVRNNELFVVAMDALQERRVARLLAEPNIMAVSGRPAKFLSGGEFAYVVPQGGGANNTFTTEFKEFGTIVDFVPIVLGNGNIRLEVRPEVSKQDFTLGTEIAGQAVPGLRKRFVETAVEMKAGQTFALAGLVEHQVNTVNRGLPYVSDLPYIGVPFRKMTDEEEEIELLILVTPEFVDPMDPHEVPCMAPGLATTNPDNSQLYCSGYVEVPHYCHPISGPLACGDNCYCNQTGYQGGPHPFSNGHGVHMPGGTGYDDSYGPSTTITDDHYQHGVPPQHLPPPSTSPDSPAELRLPTGYDDEDAGASRDSGWDASSLSGATVPRPYTPPRQPVYMRNATRPQNQPDGEAGLIGPIGYEP